eukprot:Phypoly_transcript_06940.p1 GENE.Phypoly_transcript_06940~~Phypoly_transcript_06940.p1  ORF type:complete len:287 (+),score=32.68 Phypoly_transcript_06940:88-948(+)
MSAPFKLKQSFSIFGGDSEEAAPPLKAPAKTSRPSFLDEDRDNELSFGFPSDKPASHQNERLPPAEPKASRPSVESTRPRFSLTSTPQHNTGDSQLPSEDTASPQSSQPHQIQPPQDTASQQSSRLARSRPVLPGSPPVSAQRSFPTSPPASPHNREVHSPVFSQSPSRAQSPSSSPTALVPHESMHSIPEDQPEATGQRSDPHRKKFSFTPSSVTTSRARSFQLPSSNTEKSHEIPDRGHDSTPSVTRQFKGQANEEQSNFDNTISKSSRNFKFSSYECVTVGLI